MCLKIAALSLLLLGFFYNDLFAQNKYYEKGFIILQQDTLFGFIESTDNILLSRSVSFKDRKEASVSAQTFTPVDLDGFGFTESKHVFAPVEVVMPLDSGMMIETRFAKVLVEGETSLYKLQLPKTEKREVNLKNNLYVYILKKDGGYTTLRQYESKTDNLIRLDKKYIGIIKALLSDCLNPLVDIQDKLQFRDKAMVDLIMKYNACKDPDVPSIVHEYIVKAEVRHGLEGQYGKIYEPGYDGAFSSNTFSAGYYWDITRPERSRKLSESVGISYYNMKARYQDAGSTDEHHLDNHFIRMYLHGQYILGNYSVNLPATFVKGGLTGLFSYGLFVERVVDFMPLFNIGGGMYYKRMKISGSVDIAELKWKSSKLFNIGIGVRLDRLKQ